MKFNIKQYTVGNIMTQLQGGYASNFSNLHLHKPARETYYYVYSRSANPTRTALEGAG
jgi:hypothetical protein